MCLEAHSAYVQSKFVRRDAEAARKKNVKELQPIVNKSISHEKDSGSLSKHNVGVLMDVASGKTSPTNTEVSSGSEGDENPVLRTSRKTTTIKKVGSSSAQSQKGDGWARLFGFSKSVDTASFLCDDAL